MDDIHKINQVGVQFQPTIPLLNFSREREYDKQEVKKTENRE